MDYVAITQSVLSSLPEIVVLGAASILLALDLFVRKRHGAILAYLSIVVVLSAVLLTVLPVGADGPGYSGMFVSDGFARFFKLLFYIATLLSILLSMNYLKIENVDIGEYYVLMLFALGGMMVVASATDLISAYIGLELTALSVYVLTGFIKRQERSNEAALKYVILSAVSSCLLLYGISLFYGLTGSTQFTALAEALASHARIDSAVILATLFIIAGFAFKVAAVPFHMWTPDVYEGAPTSITAFMSVGPKVAGFAVLLRVFLDALAPVAELWLAVWAAIAVATLALGSLVALVQTNIKRMLAYSSIAHAGYALLGVIAGGRDGVASVMLYLAIYTFMNLGIFAAVIAMRKGEVSGEEIDGYAGLSKSHPVMALVMLVFLFSLAGIPPTAGFFAKFYIFMALIHQDQIALAVVAVLFSAVAAFFYLRIVMLIYMREPGQVFDLSQPLSLRIVLAVTAIATLGIGVFPGWFLELAQRSVF